MVNDSRKYSSRNFTIANRKSYKRNTKARKTKVRKRDGYLFYFEFSPFVSFVFLFGGHRVGCHCRPRAVIISRLARISQGVP
jgi:hypothetical protein